MSASASAPTSKKSSSQKILLLTPKSSKLSSKNSSSAISSLDSSRLKPKTSSKKSLRSKKTTASWLNLLKNWSAACVRPRPQPSPVTNRKQHCVNQNGKSIRCVRICLRCATKIRIYRVVSKSSKSSKLQSETQCRAAALT